VLEELFRIEKSANAINVSDYTFPPFVIYAFRDDTIKSFAMQTRKGLQTMVRN